jgi:MoxR-like ATPase
MQEAGSRNIDDKSQSGVWGEGTVWTKMITDKKDEQSEEEWVWLPPDAFGTFGNKSIANSVYAPISSVDLLEMIDYIWKSIRVDEKIYDYVGDILSFLRKLTLPSESIKFPLLDYGPSTRAGLALIRTSRIRALMEGRDYVIPEDIKYLAHDILDHRIGLSYEALSEWYSTYKITAHILDEIRIP